MQQKSQVRFVEICVVGCNIWAPKSSLGRRRFESRIPRSKRQALKLDCDATISARVQMKVNRFECIPKSKVFMDETIESCMRVRGLELKPMHMLAPSFLLTLKSRYGFDEMSVSRLANLGVPETIRGFLWTQHSRQHVMWQMIRASEHTRAKDGARRIVMIVTYQQPV